MPATPKLALLAALAQTGCLVGGGLPPSRLDVGPSVNSVDGASKSHVHITAGAHVASGVFKPGLPFDAGIGYVVEHIAVKPEPGEEASEAKRGAYLHGAYAEGAVAVPIGPRGSRTWFGGRTELLIDRGRPGFGLIERIAWEGFTRANGSGPIKSHCAFGASASYGAAAAGVFVEGGYQWLPQGGRAVQVTAGVTLRVPAMAAIVLAIPYCK